MAAGSTAGLWSASVRELKTESEAQSAVDALRLTINEQTPRQQLKEISFGTLVQHYRQHEMPDIFYQKSQLPGDVAEDENRKSYATQDTYEGYLKKWILPTLEIVSPSGCEGGAGGAVAEIPSVGARQQGEAQEHHERRVQPCHSLGMGNTQSHHLRSAECQAEKDSDRPDHRADQGISLKPERALPNCGLARCVKRAASRRVAWASNGRT